MKRLVIVVVFILFAAGARAQEGYRADSAAAAGYTPFEAFHHIMAPAWHQAWPKKDYEALLAAGPKFAEAFVAIEQLKPKFKTEARQQAFIKHRKRFAELVKQYAEAGEHAPKKIDRLRPDVGEDPSIGVGFPGNGVGRLETDGETDVGPSVFRLAQRRNWELGELRPGLRTLESVFREVVATGTSEKGRDLEVTP